MSGSKIYNSREISNGREMSKFAWLTANSCVVQYLDKLNLLNHPSSE